MAAADDRGDRVTGPECFSPLADQHTPKKFLPPCSAKGCPTPARGGVAVEWEKVYPIGCPIVRVKFWCADHAPGSFALMADRLYPCWQVLHSVGPSEMKLRRLTREEQIARVQG